MTHIINEKYMLTPENIIKFLPSKINTKKDIQQSNKENRPNTGNNIDQLFWIIYKIVEGEEKYEFN